MVKFKILLEYESDTGKMELADIEEKEYPKNLVHWGWDQLTQTPIYADENAPSPEAKFDSHHNHKRKVAFESELAYSALQHAELFLPMLHKLGENLKTYLESHLSEDQKLEAGEHFREYLYSDEGIFGVLGKHETAFHLTNEEIYHNALKLLTQGDKVEEIINAHVGTLGIFRQILHCENNDDYKKWYTKLRDQNLFSVRGREKDEKAIKVLVDKPGIDENLNAVSTSVQMHRRAIDRTVRDHMDVSAFAYDAYQKEIPFVSGPSGTMAECLVGAMMAAENVLTPEDLQEYAFCCMGYLISAGTHSLHEIYIIANAIGIPYDSGRYETVIPESYKSTQSYLSLIEKYNDLIAKGNSLPYVPSTTQLLRDLSYSSAESRKSFSMNSENSETPSLGDSRASLSTTHDFSEKPVIDKGSALAKKRGLKQSLKISLFNPSKPSEEDTTQLANTKTPKSKI